MNEITIKGETPNAAVAMLLTLAKPHFIGTRPAANENLGTGPQMGAGTLDKVVAGQPEAQVSTTEQPAIEPVAERPQRRRNAPKPKVVVTAKWPDGSDKTFDTANEAVADMADALDLCDSKEAVEKFLNDNVVITEAASVEARDALTGFANDRIQTIAEAEASEGGEDPLPPSDQVGGKEQPDELELPPHLDQRKKGAAAKVPDIAFVRKLLAAYPAAANATIEDVAKLLKKHGSTKTPPNLSTIPEANRAALVAEMRKHVTTETVPDEA